MKQRSNELELIDKGNAYYVHEEYTECLYQMGRIGLLLGGDRATMQVITQYAKQPLSILDVGCGGGALADRLAKIFPRVHITGIDTSLEAISYAQRYASDRVVFEHRTNPVLKEPEKSYDIVMATLVCHHLSDEQIIDFLKRAARVARKAVIINDLHRHWLAYISFQVIAPLLFPNRLIKHDGLLSIKRSFVRSELQSLLDCAGLKGTVSWYPLFRWLVKVEPS